MSGVALKCLEVALQDVHLWARRRRITPTAHGATPGRAQGQYTCACLPQLVTGSRAAGCAGSEERAYYAPEHTGSPSKLVHSFVLGFYAGNALHGRSACIKTCQTSTAYHRSLVGLAWISRTRRVPLRVGGLPRALLLLHLPSSLQMIALGIEGSANKVGVGIVCEDGTILANPRHTCGRSGTCIEPLQAENQDVY